MEGRKAERGKRDGGRREGIEMREREDEWKER